MQLFPFCRVRLLLSVSLRREAHLHGIGHVPDPGVAILLPTAEDLHLHATSHLHVCHGIAHHSGGPLHSTTAHHPVIIGRESYQLEFCNSSFYLLFFFTPGLLRGHIVISLYIHTFQSAPPHSLKDFSWFFYTPICYLKAGLLGLFSVFGHCVTNMRFLP